MATRKIAKRKCKGLIEVLMNRKINHDNVSEYDTYHIDFRCTPELKKKIDSGWIVFRIQTEIHGNSHCTVVYLAKMKKK